MMGKKAIQADLSDFHDADPAGQSLWELRRKSDRQRYALWDALSEFGCNDTDKALRFCMREICNMIDARNAFWVAAVRMERGKEACEDMLEGWRMGAVEPLVPGYTSRERMNEAIRLFSEGGDVGMTTRHVLAFAGTFRVYALSQGMVDLKAFQQTESYDYFYRRPGIVDRIWVVFPVNEDTESCFCFDRFEGQPCFDARDAKVAAEVLRGIKWFHRQLLLCRGLGVAEQGLSPTERRIVRELLTGATEKVIAGRLDVTPASAHQYVARVFRKYGVRSRSEFMALWLNTLN